MSHGLQSELFFIWMMMKNMMNIFIIKSTIPIIFR